MRGRTKGRAGSTRSTRFVRLGLDSVVVALTVSLGVAVASGMAQARSTVDAGRGQQAQTSMSVPSTVSTTAVTPTGAPEPTGAGILQQVSASVGPAGSTATGAVGSVQQTLTVSVRPGGPIRISPDRVTVTLHRSGNLLVGSLGPVELTDPRGTLDGWELVVRLAADTGLRSGPTVQVVPGDPTAVTGRPSEVRAAGPHLLGPDGAVLMSAPRGGGGGTFRVEATVGLPAVGDAVEGSVTLLLAAAPVPAHP